MKKRIPKFKSLEEERKFWDTHSITEFIGELKPAEIRFAQPKKKLVSLRLDTDLIKSVKEISARKKLGYLSLIRYWLAERISKERSLMHAQQG